ncbi:MAG: PfkB family carbohydrate kinase [Betaproteobacteria bacterium]|nr:PfkB family carbohydrate kinase [Betaproteobacteria bacterium]
MATQSNEGARVVCVGHSALDYVFGVDEFGTVGAKLRATRFREAGGGMAANAAVAVAALGGRAVLCGVVGDDAAGSRMRSELAAWGVDVSGLRALPGAASSVSAVIVNGRGERLIVNFRGDALQTPPDTTLRAAVETADAVLADVRWVPGARAALEGARRRGVPTVLDADIAERAELEALCALAGHAIFSEQALAQFAPGASVETALRTALAHGAELAAVTCGAQGVRWLQRGANRLAALPAFAVQVRDTTGAGDAFHGAYALALAEGMPPRAALRFASGAAALKCAREGARSVPSRTEVMQLLSETT